MENEKHKKFIKPLIIVGLILVVIGSIVAFVPFNKIQSKLITTMAINYAKENNKEAGYTNNSIVTFCEVDNFLFKGVSLGYEDDSYVVMNVGQNGKLYTNIVNGDGVDSCTKSQKILMYDMNSAEMALADIVGSFTSYDVYYINGNNEVLLTPGNAANYLNVNIGTKITLKFVDKNNSSNTYTALVSMKDANLPVIGAIHEGKFIDLDDLGEIEVEQFDEDFMNEYQIVGVTKEGQSILLSANASLDITKTGKQVITYSYTTSGGITIKKEITFKVTEKTKISITGVNVKYEWTSQTVGYDKAKISVTTNISSNVRLSLDNKDFKYIDYIYVTQNGTYKIYAKDVSTGDVSPAYTVDVTDIGKKIPSSDPPHNPPTNPPVYDPPADPQNSSYSVSFSNENNGKWTKGAQTITITPKKNDKYANIDAYYCVTSSDTCTPSTKGKSVKVENNNEKVCAYVKESDDKKSDVACSQPVMIDSIKPIVSVNTIGEVKKNEKNEIISKFINVGLSVEALSGVKEVKYCQGTSQCTPNKNVTDNYSNVTKLTETGYVCASAKNTLGVQGDKVCQEYRFASEAETGDETEFNETINVSYNENTKTINIVATSVGGELSKHFTIKFTGVINKEVTVTGTLSENNTKCVASYVVENDADGDVGCVVSSVSGPNNLTYTSSKITFRYIIDEPAPGGACELRVYSGNLDPTGTFYTGDVSVKMFNLDDSKTVSDVTINSTKNVTTGLIIHSSSTVHGKMTYTDNTTCEADLSINIDSSGVDLSTMAIGGISCSVYYDESGKMTYGYVFNFKEHNDYGSFHARWGLGVGDFEYNSIKFTGRMSEFEPEPMVIVTLKDGEGNNVRQLPMYTQHLELDQCAGYKNDNDIIKEKYQAKIYGDKVYTTPENTQYVGGKLYFDVTGSSEFDKDVKFYGALYNDRYDLTVGERKSVDLPGNGSVVTAGIYASIGGEDIKLKNVTFTVDGVTPKVNVTRVGNTLTGKLDDSVVIPSGIAKIGWKYNGQDIGVDKNSIDASKYGNGTFTYYVTSNMDITGTQNYEVSDLNGKHFSVTSNLVGYDKSDNAYYGNCSFIITSNKSIKRVLYVGSGKPSSTHIGNVWTFTGVTNPTGGSFHFTITYEDDSTESTQTFNQTIYRSKVSHSITENYRDNKYVYTATNGFDGTYTCSFSLSNGYSSTKSGGTSMTLSTDTRVQSARLVCSSSSDSRTFMKYFSGNVDDAQASCKLTGVSDGALYKGQPKLGVTGGDMYRGQYRTSIVPSSPGTYTFHCKDVLAASGPDVTFTIVSASELDSMTIGSKVRMAKNANSVPVAYVTPVVSGNTSYISQYCLDSNCSSSIKEFEVTNSNVHELSYKLKVIDPNTGTNVPGKSSSFSIPQSSFIAASSSDPACSFDFANDHVNFVVNNLESDKVKNVRITVDRKSISNGASLSESGLNDGKTHSFYGAFADENGKSYNCNGSYKYNPSCDISKTSLSLNGSSIVIDYKVDENGKAVSFSNGTIASTTLGTIVNNSTIELKSTNYKNTGNVIVKKDDCNGTYTLSYTYYYYDDSYHTEPRAEEAACSIKLTNVTKGDKVYKSAYVTVEADQLAKNVKLYVDDKAQMGLSINALEGTHSYKCGSTGYDSQNYGKEIYSNATTIEVDSRTIHLDVSNETLTENNKISLTLGANFDDGTAVPSSEVSFKINGKSTQRNVTNLEPNTNYTITATYTKTGASDIAQYLTAEIVTGDLSLTISGGKNNFYQAKSALVSKVGTKLYVTVKAGGKTVGIDSIKDIEYKIDSSKVDSLVVKEGSHYYIATATLINGKSVTNTVAITADNTSPSISNVTYLNSTGSLSFTVSDDYGLALAVVKGCRYEKLPIDDGATSKRFTVDASSCLTGSRDLTIDVRDAVGNTATYNVETSSQDDEINCSLSLTTRPNTDGYYYAKPSIMMSFSSSQGKKFSNDTKDYSLGIYNGSSKKSISISAEYGNHIYVGKVVSPNGNSNECRLELDLDEKFVDTEKPTIDSINYNKDTKVLTIKASDDKSGIQKYAVTGYGTNNTGSFTNIDSGKSLTVFVYDNVGHVTSQTYKTEEGTVGTSACNYVLTDKDKTYSGTYHRNVAVSLIATDTGETISDFKSHAGTFDLPSGALSSTGTYTYTTSYKDSKNRSVTCTTTVKIDADEPTVKSKSVNSSTGAISYSFQDSLSGMRYVHLLYNGTLVSSGVGAISYTATKNGTYIVEASDLAGNETALPVTITSLPSGSGCNLYTDNSANANGWYTSAPIVRYTKTGQAELSSKTFYLNNVTAGSSISNVKLKEGSNTVKVVQLEKDNVTTSECSITVNVDSVAPNASISYNEKSDKISYSVSDSSSKIATATLYRGGNVVWTVSNISTKVGEITKPEAGLYKLDVTDKAGNSNSVNVTVSKVNPQLPPEVGSCTLTANSNPNNYGWYKVAPNITSVPKLVNGESPRRICVAIGSTSCSVSSVKASEGTNTYKGTVETTQHTYSCEITIQVDSKAPAVGLSYNENTKRIGASGVDSVSGIAKLDLYFGSSIVKTTSDGSFSYAPTKNGTYRLVVTDKAGNTAEKSVSVTNAEATEPETPQSADTSCSFNITGGGISNGWYNKNVTVALVVPSGATSAKVNRSSTTSYTANEGENTYTGTYTLSGVIHSCTANVKVDATLPSVGTAYNEGTGVMAVSSSDNGSGLKSIRIAYNGANVNTKSCSGGSCSTTYSPSATGTYYYYVTDNAGNVKSGTISVYKLPSSTTKSTTCTLSVSGGSKGSNDWYTSAPTFNVSVNGTDGIRTKTITRGATTVSAPLEGSNTYAASVVTNSGDTLTCNNVTVKLDTVDPVTNFNVNSNGRLASNSNSGSSAISSYVWTIGGGQVGTGYQYYARFTSSTYVTLTVTDLSGRSSSKTTLVNVSSTSSCPDGYTKLSTGNCYKGPEYTYGPWTTTLDTNKSGTAYQKDTCANPANGATSCEIITPRSTPECQYGMGLGSSCYHQVKKTRTKTLVSAASTIDQSVSYSYY